MSVLVNIGHSYSDVAALLKSHKSTVQRQMKKFKQTQSFVDKEKKEGRQNLLRRSNSN
jgi:transposase